jgi:hypothetical protein
MFNKKQKSTVLALFSLSVLSLIGTFGLIYFGSSDSPGKAQAAEEEKIEIEITLPEHSAVITPANSNIPISVNVIQNGENIQEITFTEITDFDTPSNNTILGSIDAPPYEFTWQTVPEGDHLVKVDALNKTDNSISDTEYVWFNVTDDETITPPEVQVAIEEGKINITTSDDGEITQVQAFECRQECELLESADGGSLSFDWTNSGTSEITILAKALDESGLVGVNETKSTVNENPNNQEPVVKIIPLNISNFQEPVNLNLQAEVVNSDNNNEITKVEFYDGTLLLGDGTLNPETGYYELEWVEVLAGDYSITAKAVNSSGDEYASDPLTFTIIQGDNGNQSDNESSSDLSAPTQSRTESPPVNNTPASSNPSPSAYSGNTSRDLARTGGEAFVITLVLLGGVVTVIGTYYYQKKKGLGG